MLPSGLSPGEAHITVPAQHWAQTYTMQFTGVCFQNGCLMLQLSHSAAKKGYRKTLLVDSFTPPRPSGCVREIWKERPIF